MAWDTVADAFLFNLAELIEYARSLPVTKRSLLKWSSKIFDPLGFLSPFTIRLKILFQVLCLDKIDWDGELKGESRQQWNVLISELEILKTIRVPRCYYLTKLNRLITQIHGFSDASGRAMAAVVYTRTVYTNARIDIKLMASKTKVAPVKKQTIPRLELIGATLLARLVNSLLTTLEWNVEIFYWVDSMTTLHWIRNNRNWKQYVQHRVNEIRANQFGSMDPNSWEKSKTSGQNVKLRIKPSQKKCYVKSLNNLLMSYDHLRQMTYYPRC